MRVRYKVKFFEEDGWCLAEIPGVGGGIVTQGKTLEEAREMAGDATTEAACPARVPSALAGGAGTSHHEMTGSLRVRTLQCLACARLVLRPTPYGDHDGGIDGGRLEPCHHLSGERPQIFQR